ncbi:MAG: YicC/YloC family endoribonuclease [Candidatus Brocadiia bacterium]
MIRSMTGFGAAQKVCDDWLVRVEMRTVNHRDLQTTFRTPEAFRAKEAELQKLIERRIHRGHLYYSLTCEPHGERGTALVDEELVAGYLQALKGLAAAEELPIRVDLASLLSLPGALKQMALDEDLREALWEDVLEVSGEALESLVQMRSAEGQNLAAQLREFCDEMGSLTDAIEGAQRDFVPAYQERLRERVNRLLDGTDVELNEEPLCREVAIYADRCDVSEEIARLRSHLEQFGDALAGDDSEPVGRKMEFIGQEMLREAGTIAAKVPAGEQVRQVIELKTAVERLREQVRNVE